MPHQPSADPGRDRPAAPRPGNPSLGPYETSYDVVRGYDDAPGPRPNAGAREAAAYFSGRDRRRY